MNNPLPVLRTKFEINPIYDVEGYVHLAQTAPEGIRPQTFLSTRREIEQLINSTFKDDGENILKRVLEIEIAWREIEVRFIELSMRFFNPEDVPGETYACYPTVCPLIARDSEKHRVAFPYTSTNAIACYVIAHELLHEFFYHHLFNRFGEGIDLRRKDIWDLSEVVNVYIFREESWQELFIIDVQPYEMHRSLYEKFKPMWEDAKDKPDALMRMVEFLGCVE